MLNSFINFSHSCLSSMFLCNSLNKVSAEGRMRENRLRRNLNFFPLTAYSRLVASLRVSSFHSRILVAISYSKPVTFSLESFNKQTNRHNDMADPLAPRPMVLSNIAQ
uniref:Uncharacterized protein n=1 Tax=Cacopsylla melanoneura TaxID=428564 RepID=A0A8D9A9E7_9HEMI